MPGRCACPRPRRCARLDDARLRRHDRIGARVDRYDARVAVQRPAQVVEIGAAAGREVAVGVHPLAAAGARAGDGVGGDAGRCGHAPVLHAQHAADGRAEQHQVRRIGAESRGDRAREQPAAAVADDGDGIAEALAVEVQLLLDLLGSAAADSRRSARVSSARGDSRCGGASVAAAAGRCRWRRAPAAPARCGRRRAARRARARRGRP